MDELKEECGVFGIFGHSEAGDLTPLFSGFFDTKVGTKREAASYAAIAAGLGVSCQALKFCVEKPMLRCATGRRSVS